MLIKVGNKIIDTNKTPVGLVFKTKDEAKAVANILANIKNGDTELPVDRNGNWWFKHPVSWNKEKCDKWATLTDEQKELLAGMPEVTGKLNFEL